MGHINGKYTTNHGRRKKHPRSQGKTTQTTKTEADNNVETKKVQHKPGTDNFAKYKEDVREGRREPVKPWARKKAIKEKERQLEEEKKKIEEERRKVEEEKRSVVETTEKRVGDDGHNQNKKHNEDDRWKRNNERMREWIRKKRERERGWVGEESGKIKERLEKAAVEQKMFQKEVGDKKEKPDREKDTAGGIPIVWIVGGVGVLLLASGLLGRKNSGQAQVGGFEHETKEPPANPPPQYREMDIGRGRKMRVPIRN